MRVVPVEQVARDGSGRRALGVHAPAMAWRRGMSKRVRAPAAEPGPNPNGRTASRAVGRAAARDRRRGVPAVRLRPDRRSSAAGPRSSASARRAHRPPNRSAFRRARRATATLTLTVRGAHRADDAAHRARDRRAGQPLLRLCRGRAAQIRQGEVARRARPRRPRPCRKPVPVELGEGLKAIADPELRAVLESLAAGVAATRGLPKIG